MYIVRFVTGIMFFIVVLSIFYDYSFNDRVLVLGFGENHNTAEKEIPIAGIMTSSVGMLIGIIFGSIYNRIKSIQGQVHIINEIRDTVLSAHFFRSLLVSPLIFIGVYIASKSQPDIVISTIFAFQNGFFCDSIFRKDYEKNQ